MMCSVRISLSSLHFLICTSLLPNQGVLWPLHFWVLFLPHPFSLLLGFQSHQYGILCYNHGSLRPCLFSFFQFISFCCLKWVVFIVFSSKSLILFSVPFMLIITHWCLLYDGHFKILSDDPNISAIILASIDSLFI